ncbi:hypothetical protein C1N58_17910 [Pantoea sp. SGAir0180]|nr:hypothetical protein GC087_00480 [Pantoea sp. JZ2]WRH19255.1 hypothetical protein GC090_00475 [Pantoea sp. JZ29]
MTGAAKFSQIRLREVKGLKDRTSYLCTLRLELYLIFCEQQRFFCYSHSFSATFFTMLVTKMKMTCS